MNPQVNGDEWRNALDSLEHRILRAIRDQLQPVKETTARIEREVISTNGRVTRLEQDRIRRDAADGVRAELAKQAVEVAATKAAEVVAGRDRSRKWWLGVAGAVTGGIVAITTLTGLFAQYLNHAH